MITEDDSRDGAPAASGSALSPDAGGSPDISEEAFALHEEDDEDCPDSIFGLRPSSRGIVAKEKAAAESSASPAPFFSAPDSREIPPADTNGFHNLPADHVLTHAEPEEGNHTSPDFLTGEPGSGESPAPGISREDQGALLDEDDLAEPENQSNSVTAEGGEPRWLGVRFRKTGQVYFIPDNIHAVRKGTKVLVRQENGQVLGEVSSIIEGDNLLPGRDITSPGKSIIGVATAQDIARNAENAILADEAEAFCKTCIRQRELDMKLVEVEVLHDRSKIIFYFTAPSRIDFRELVKDLVRNYRTRIELRQIGVRHESQMIGGLGNCGMVCCCHRYLRKFAPVTIKMAKEQNLFLNPAKLSGMCGRLLCCLSFEQGNYEEFNHRCPKVGKKYVTEGKGTVRILRANMFSQTISVHTDNGEELEFSLEEWANMQPRRAEPHHHDAGRASDTAHQGEEDWKSDRHKKLLDQNEGDSAPDCYGSGFPDDEAPAPLSAPGQQNGHPARKSHGKHRPGKRRQRE